MNARDTVSPEPVRTISDIVSVSDTPDAIEATSVLRRRTVSAVDQAARYGRGVEWVRPTDLVARGGSRVAGAGIDFQTELARRTRQLTATGARGLHNRARRLPPLSAFGRGTAHRGMERGPVGMT